MLRCHYVLALCRKCHHRIADSSHTAVECDDILCTGEGLDTFLKVGNRRIFTTGIVRCVDTVAKGIAHRLSIVKLIGYCIVHRHTECVVSVAPFIGPCVCFFIISLSIIVLYESSAFVPHGIQQPCTTGLIPLHSIAVTAPLVILQRVGKRGGVASEGEVIARVWSQHHRATHVEAVKVTLQRRRGH